MYYLLIIFLISLFIIILNLNESYINFNYSNDIYAIRPPYEMARLYNPNKLASFKIYKSNFLNKWIEGFENTQKDNQVINLKKQQQPALNVEKPLYLKDIQQFKFFPTEKCDAEDYSYTGAYFTVQEGVQCNEDGMMPMLKPAKVCAKIRDGKVISIGIINGGKGYKNPQISIIANDDYGEGAIAEVRAIDENGSIKYIEVTKSGHRYVRVPHVKILDIKKGDKCYLCSKMSSKKK